MITLIRHTNYTLNW